MESKFEILKPFYINHVKGKDFTMSCFHYHPEYEIYFIESGCRKVIIGTELFQLNKFDIALIKPYEIHHTSGTDYVRTVLNFSQNYLKEFFTNKVIKKLTSIFENHVVSLSADDFVHVKSILADLQKEYDGNVSADSIYLHLANLLNYISEKSKIESNMNVNKNLVSDILFYINKNYKTINSLDDIADQFLIAKSYLCRIFKKETNVTINSYITQLRMKHACELLLTKKYSIDKIADECGFNSAIYFSQCFKKEFGVSPLNYKKNHTDIKSENI